MPAMAMVVENVYEYAPQDFGYLLNILEQTLPNSIPIYRRLQLASKLPETMVFATFQPGSRISDLDTQFTVGLIDCNAPGTHSWVFSSIQMCEPEERRTPSSRTQETDVAEEKALNQLLAVLRRFQSRFAELHVSDSHGQDVLILGTVHSRIATLLRAYAHKNCPELLRDDQGGTGGGPYGKYIYRAQRVQTQPAADLPANLRFDSIRESDHDLIIANNSLVRNSQSLRYLPHGIAIRSILTGELAAFSFLGVDGCVRTLHVMPEHRRLGLGRKAAIKVAEDGLSQFGIPEEERGQAWVFADVAEDNVESVGLFKGLGGQKAYDSFWLRLDLTKLQHHDGNPSAL